MKISTTPRASGWTATEGNPPIDSLPASLRSRFKDSVRSLTGDAAGQLGVAVSGGPDSLALLLLAADLFPGRVRAATVDHGLRAESGAEAALAACYCDELGVPHATLRVEIGEGNLSDRARDARYGALARWASREGVSHLATAHHADDQVETLLMRLNRGSGVAGLSGIRACTEISGLRVIRPLLDWRRAELVGLVERRGWKPVDDPSNLDPRYDRARMRMAITQADWLDPRAIAASAAHLADADAALDWMADRLWAEGVEPDGDRWAMPADLPRALAARIVARMLDRIGAGTPRGSEVARLCEALAAGKVATLAGVVARPGKAVWRFGKAPERRG